MDAQRSARPEPTSEATSGCQRTPALTVGELVGGTYKILRRVGRGGMSDVFAVEHLRLGRVLALKMLRTELADGERAVERFRREARAIANLNSEFVVQVVDCGEHDDRIPYLVMELLEGQDLRSLLKLQGMLPLARVVPLMLELCRGLDRVHAAGLTHRDLKPENLFVARRESGEDWCKVLDFGIAKMQSGLATTEGTVVGTVRYMAPEQLADGDSVGPTTDIYAVGAILYECLSGQPLHQGSTVQEVMFRVMNQSPVALSSLCPQLPPELCKLVARTTAKQQLERPQTANELAALLVTACSGPSAENPTLADVRRVSTTPALFSMRVRRAVVGLVVCLALVVAWLGGRFARPARAPVAGVNVVTVGASTPNDESSERAPQLAVAPPSSGSSATAHSFSVAVKQNAPVTAKARGTRQPPKPVGSAGELPVEGQFDQVDPYAK